MANRKDSSWEDDLAKEASQERAREKAGTGGLSNRLSIKGRRFTFDGENLGRTLKCVVIDFVYVNTFYSSGYKEDSVNMPKCFAMSEDGEDMRPHNNSQKKQNKNCEDCPRSQWYKGRKECQERRRLAIIAEEDLDDVENAKVAFLDLPVTSVKHWSKFMANCDTKLHRPFYTVVCELSFDEDKEYPVVTFAVEEKIKEKDIIEDIRALREDTRDDLMTPFDKPTSSRSRDDDDEDERPRRRRSRDDDEDDDDDKPTRRRRSKDEDDDDDRPTRRRRSRSRDDENDDEDDKPTRRRSRDDEDDDDEDDKPTRRRRSKDDDDDDDKPTRRKKPARRGDDDDDEDDEDDETDDEEDDDEDDKPSRRSQRSKGKRRRASRKDVRDNEDADEDDEDDDDGDDEDDKRSSRTRRSGKTNKGADRPAKKKGSRFGKR